MSEDNRPSGFIPIAGCPAKAIRVAEPLRPELEGRVA
ncbi:MAG: hypothetical protein JWQ75_361 [Pseudarthrobacter sp.]|nr:hypothetical protein [Pseudarthrobacter sp.]